MIPKTLFFGLFLVLIATVACTASPLESEREAYKLGIVLSLSGYAAEYGENSRDGMLLAAKEINAAGGINGIPLELIFEDDGTVGRNAVTSAQKLVNVDQVDALVGGTWDLSSIPLTAFAQEKNIVHIVTSNGNTEDSRAGTTLFRTAPSIAAQVERFDTIFQQAPPTRVAILRNTGAFSDAHKNAFETLAQKYGAEVLDLPAPNLDSNEWGTQLIKLKEFKPDVVYVPTGKNDLLLLLKKFEEHSILATVFTDENMLIVHQGDLISTDKIEGVYSVSTTPINPEFEAAYMAAYNQEPPVSAFASYEAIHYLAQAFAQVGTRTSDVIAFLEQTGDFDHNGDMLVNLPLYQMRSGEFVLVE